MKFAENLLPEVVTMTQLRENGFIREISLREGKDWYQIEIFAVLTIQFPESKWYEDIAIITNSYI